MISLRFISSLIGWITILSGALTACGGSSYEEPLPVVVDTEPRRIVSLDYCADQFVLKFVDREDILAISPEGTAPFSYMRDEAIGIPTIRPLAEDVLILEPDLIVRSYGGGPQAAAFFERAGIPVLDVGWTSTLEEVMANVERMASALGAPDEGKSVVADMQRRLATHAHQGQENEALYMTSGGVTTGSGSLVHEMLLAAGLKNFQREPGWRTLPLERLAYEQPDLIAASFFGSSTNHLDAWSPANHPVARAQLDDRPVAALDGSWTSCGGWFVVEAVEALAEATAP